MRGYCDIRRLSGMLMEECTRVDQYVCRPIGKDEVDGVIEELVFSLVSCCAGMGESRRLSGMLIEECTRVDLCV